MATATEETNFLDKEFSGGAANMYRKNVESVLSPWTQSLFAFMASTIMTVRSLDLIPMK